MAVLIDPPLWPAHGTVFSHLVSDSSLEELHELVGRTSISPRAFDHDHYDVPAHLIDEAVAAGATRVSAHELTRRLTASGLRIPAKERPARLRRRLAREWKDLVPTAPELGDFLLDRWDAPGREYHTSVHLSEVLGNVRTLGNAESVGPESSRILSIASWYHDAVYHGIPGKDERASAELAVAHLTGHVETAEISRAQAIILGTIDHTQASKESLWPIFHDADLGILAASRERYERYVASVRREYCRVPEGVFRSTRAEILEGFLGQDALYLTDWAKRWWEEKARQNLRSEIKALRSE
ncbi:DUF4031 domain-containing protein [Rothia uropygialis]|uniref:DUF4031 domain-containing protein n=1 Tax=Kocuria sp. 36 TaxID=1415402 RepID=UPI00101B9511|nr:DUF4031 domain-containing protein [Kocuria sp. 36]